MLIFFLNSNDVIKIIQQVVISAKIVEDIDKSLSDFNINNAKFCFIKVGFQWIIISFNNPSILNKHNI